MASNATAPVFQGWTSSPQNRGTADILSSCALTILLCCWTTVYPNVPSLSDSKWAKFRDKANMACIGLLGPEFLLGIATGQKTSAERSLKKFKALGLTSWTIRHSFLADMGGFHLETIDFPNFPIDAEQLYYLVVGGFIDYPEITKMDIEDKNKSDGLARWIAIIQAVWFLTSTIGRPIQGLAVTTLELTTASFVMIMLASSYWWKDKPADISRPYALRAKVPVSEIRRLGGIDSELPWAYTPLDFISRQETPQSLMWLYYNELLRRLHLPVFFREVKSSPYDRIPSDRFLATDTRHEIISEVFILAFGAIFLAAWNFHFPTRTEKILWWAVSIYNMVFCTLGAFHLFVWGHYLYPRRHTEKSVFGPQPKPYSRTFNRFLDCIRNISPTKDPLLEVPLGLLVPNMFFSSLYTVARGYIFVEDIIGLRSLPASAYVNVDWARYIPHF